MRVIAGTARRLELKTIQGMDTRPTTDRIKETVFNMLAPDIPQCIFLDLFAGSGQMGIEALSRGAKNAYFVEHGREAVKCIKENLSHTKLVEKGIVMPNDVMTAIHILSERKVKFDIIYMDPPYKGGYEQELLTALGSSTICDEDTIIIFEAEKRMNLMDFASNAGFVIVKEKQYKTNKHVFLQKK